MGFSSKYSELQLIVSLKNNTKTFKKINEYVGIYIKTKKEQEEDWDGTLTRKLNTTST